MIETNVDTQNDEPTPSQNDTQRSNPEPLVAPEHKQRKLELQAKLHWDVFYRRNKGNFFKDRHWTRADFLKLCPYVNWEEPLRILEAGCGVGNLIYPLLESFPNITAFCFDFSKIAIKHLKADLRYSEDRCTAFQFDLTSDDDLTQYVPCSSISVATLVFCLSALHPDKMVTALKTLRKTLNKGGYLIIRDYAIDDHAMLRFAPHQKLSECFYYRNDGTRAFFFEAAKLEQLAVSAGFEVIKLDYLDKRTVNYKENIDVPRRFISCLLHNPDHII